MENYKKSKYVWADYHIAKIFRNIYIRIKNNHNKMALENKYASVIFAIILVLVLVVA